jgi:5-methylcytosine-specific restriction protein B
MAAVGPSVEFPANDGGDIVEIEEGPSYTLDDIINDGCFLRTEELSEILARWRSKKNVILQGPPGTGKTWLAIRRLPTRISCVGGVRRAMAGSPLSMAS